MELVTSQITRAHELVAGEKLGFNGFCRTFCGGRFASKRGADQGNTGTLPLLHIKDVAYIHEWQTAESALRVEAATGLNTSTKAVYPDVGVRCYDQSRCRTDDDGGHGGGDQDADGKSARVGQMRSEAECRRAARNQSKRRNELWETLIV